MHNLRCGSAPLPATTPNGRQSSGVRTCTDMCEEILRMGWNLCRTDSDREEWVEGLTNWLNDQLDR